MKIFNEDCLKVLPELEDASIDLCVADPPYAQTRNKWDVEIPLEDLWKELKRVVKPNGAIILFGQGMFTAKVMTSNPKMWRYNLIWDKQLKSGFLNAKRMPLRQHEDIMIFYKKPPVYNPQMTQGEPNHSRNDTGKPYTNNNYGEYSYAPINFDGMKYPVSIISIPRKHSSIMLHPTEKPVELIEYLIKTYSNEGETVLDFCMGVGSTGIACKNTNRDFVGIELDKEYFDIADEQINGGK